MGGRVWFGHWWALQMQWPRLRGRLDFEFDLSNQFYFDLLSKLFGSVTKISDVISDIILSFVYILVFWGVKRKYS